MVQILFLAGSCSVLAALATLMVFTGPLRRYRMKAGLIRQLRGTSPYLDEELERSFYQRFLHPLVQRWCRAMQRMGKRRSRASNPSRWVNPKVEQELRLAGIRLSSQDFMLLRLLTCLVGMGLALGIALFTTRDGGIRLLILLFAGALSVALPRFLLQNRIKTRQMLIQNQMPNVMDVLCVSIEAGLGFDAALLRVLERFSGPLIDELAQVYREVQMGRPRREALVGLGQRCSVQELQTFASALVQSEEFGTPIKNVLRTQAEQLRVSRRQQAQEKGMKAPVRMMLPMVTFIFPVIFIVLLGPTVIHLIDQFT